MRIKIIFCLLAVLSVSACSSGEEATHEEKMVSEEQAAQEEAELTAASVKGVGNAMSGAGSEAAESLSQGVTNVISGIGSGIEKGTEYPISVNENLASKGVNCTLATRNMNSPETNAVSIYVTFDAEIDTALQLRAYAPNNVEIGRSNRIPVVAEADDGTYLHFAFDNQTPLTRVEKIILLEVKKPTSVQETAPDTDTPAEPEAF